MEKKSFGWWFSYPWASLKGTVNTACRYAFGTVGVAAVVTYGFALRAVWEISLPILKIGKETAAGTVHATYAVLEFSWGLGVNQLLLGSAVPISGYAWTTVVDGPMSLLGRAPTPSSADGWWVVMIEEENRHIRQLSPTVQRYVSIMEW